MEKDPVCNMAVKRDAALSATHGGRTYYFCSEGCRDAFLRRPTRKGVREVYDLIILGGGPAGLTAAVYSAILKMDALLLTERLGGQAIDSAQIENYMGHDFISGTELIEKFQHQLLHSHYLDHRLCKASRIVAADHGFRVTDTEGNTYGARTLIVATGMTRRRLNVPGEETFQRRGVFYGNIEDFSFLHDQDAAVIGGGNSALQIVENLQAVARRIHLVSTSRLSADPSILERTRGHPALHVYEGFHVREIGGDKAVSSITLRPAAGGAAVPIPVKGVFIAIGLQPNASIVSQLVFLNPKGEIPIHPDCSTTCPGLFAAGDVTDAFGKRIIIACGEGAKAALAARQYLLRLRSNPAQAKRAPPTGTRSASAEKDAPRYREPSP